MKRLVYVANVSAAACVVVGQLDTREETFSSRQDHVIQLVGKGIREIGPQSFTHSSKTGLVFYGVEETTPVCVWVPARQFRMPLRCAPGLRPWRVFLDDAAVVMIV